MRLGQVDPWVGNHLILAEAKGSLTGSTSMVQNQAIQILKMLEEGRREDRRADLVKASLLANEKYRPDKIFPDLFSLEEGDEVEGEYDESIPDPSEIEEMDRWIREREQSMTLAEMDDLGGWR